MWRGLTPQHLALTARSVNGRCVSMNDRTNMPVPDELAAVREQIKRLESREEELKKLVLENPDVRTGADWIAEVKTAETTRTDIKELRANHPDIVEQYTFKVPVTRVVLSGVSDDGEIVNARRFRSLKEPE
jgi:predicted phage-related endonuclease